MQVTTNEQSALVSGAGQGFWGSDFRPEGSGTGGLYEGLFENGLGDLLVLSQDLPAANGDRNGALNEGQRGEQEGAPRPAGSGQQRVRAGAEARASGGGSCKKRQELIVVASLLDKAENLAGLSRTCEGFWGRGGGFFYPALYLLRCALRPVLICFPQTFPAQPCSLTLPCYSF
eukprot:1159778-Pelagomonas_calceolata.AAC.23